MPHPKRAYKNSALQQRAKTLTAATKAAARKAEATARPADKEKAFAIAHEAAGVVQDANRERFLEMGTAHAKTALEALDRIAQLCERRKYRVLPADEARILRPILDAVSELGDAWRLAIGRKRIMPTPQQLFKPDPLPPVR